MEISWNWNMQWFLGNRTLPHLQSRVGRIFAISRPDTRFFENTALGSSGRPFSPDFYIFTFSSHFPLTLFQLALITPPRPRRWPWGIVFQDFSQRRLRFWRLGLWKTPLWRLRLLLAEAPRRFESFWATHKHKHWFVRSVVWGSQQKQTNTRWFPIHLTWQEEVAGGFLCYKKLRVQDSDLGWVGSIEKENHSRITELP